MLLRRLAFHRVLITGASSGIGQALSVALAGPCITLHLGDRDAARLEAVTEACRAKGAEAHPHAVSVTDAAAMQVWIARVAPLDLVIANAGISGGTAEAVESEAQTRASFATNLDGMLNTVLPAMALMAAQLADAAGVGGRIAVVASIAAFPRGPRPPAYCASKAAVDSWIVGTAPSARRQGIRMTSLCPGFIATPMTAANDFPMPSFMSADRAAEIMLLAIRLEMTRCAFPVWMAAGARLADFLPASCRGKPSPAASPPKAPCS